MELPKLETTHRTPAMRQEPVAPTGSTLTPRLDRYRQHVAWDAKTAAGKKGPGRSTRVHTESPRTHTRCAATEAGPQQARGPWRWEGGTALAPDGSHPDHSGGSTDVHSAAHVQSVLTHMCQVPVCHFYLKTDIKKFK